MLGVVIGFVSINDMYGAKLNLKINHKLGDKPFELNKLSSNNLGDKFTVNNLAYYLSDFTIIHDGGVKTKLDSTYLLIYANSKPTLDLVADLDLKNITIQNFEGIEFGIGVPAPVNNDDPTKWPGFHALSPKSPSMHWGWASGYRFIAMEGKGGEFGFADFEIHALGNENYGTTTITTGIKADDNGDYNVVLNADYNRALENLNVDAGIINHSGDGEAVTMLNNFKQYVFTPAIISSVEENKYEENLVQIYPNPNNGNFEIKMSDLKVNNSNSEINNIKIFDNLGKLVKEINQINLENIKVNIDQKGSFVVGFYNNNELLISKNVVVE